VSGFRITGRIGAGAMGTVYRAWQQGTERLVALKVLHGELAAQADMVQRFTREARAVARLNHPNIAAIYTTGRTGDGRPCIVMEYVDGPSLEDLLAATGRLPVQRALQLAGQMSAALAAAHAAGIVHRDLKPENVLVAGGPAAGRDGEDRVKLLDFGIARLSCGEDTARLTRDGQIFGTPDYLAPEQARAGTVDHRCDLYSLGVTLYRMVTGRLPFAGGLAEVLLAHIERPPPDPRVHRPELPELVARLILWCLAKEPGQRPGSAAALQRAIEAALAAIPRCPAPPPGAADTALVRSVPEVPGAGSGCSGRCAEEGRSCPACTRTQVGIAAAQIAATRAARSAAGISSEDRRLAAVLPRRRSLRRWTACCALVTALLVGGGGAVRALYEPTSAAPAAAGRSHGAEPVVSALPSRGPRRAILVSEAGHALRVLVPERLRVDVVYEIVLDAWAPGGAPLLDDRLDVFLVSSTGEMRGLAAQRGDLPGRYLLEQQFTTPGRYALEVVLATADLRLRVPLEVGATRPGASPAASRARARRSGPRRGAGHPLLASQRAHHPAARVAAAGGAW
jgi:serine/threonine-protein kinase